MKFQWNKYIAELIGTFGLVFFGTGAIAVNDISGGQITHLGVSVVFGFIVMAMIYAFGAASGAHINPAVSVAFWISGRLTPSRTAFYVLFQILGAILASLTIRVLFPTHPDLGATLPSGSWSQSFVLETILTFFLMTVILFVSTGSKELGIMAGLAIGATVLLEALFAGPISGASMNPARSLGPALVSGELNHLWIYISAPIIGAILAVPVYGFIKQKA